MNSLSVSDRQLRDSIIIELDVLEGYRIGKPSVEIVYEMNFKKSELVFSSISYDIDAPLILLEGDREDNSILDYFLDPSINSDLLPKHIYFPKWAGFTRLISSKKYVENQTQQNYAYSLLRRAVLHCRRNYGASVAKNFVRRLHDNRWAIGAEMTASLYTTAIVNNDSDEFKKFANDKDFVHEYISEVRQKLNTFKQNVKNLTEWNEALYSINPDVWELMKYLKYSNLPDAEKWYRFFAEVDADIASTSIRATFSVSEKSKNKRTAGWLTLFESKRSGPGSFSEFKGILGYLLNSRTSIPQFWMDLALQHYDTPIHCLPLDIYDVDPWNAVSIDILRAWSMSWMINE